MEAVLASELESGVMGIKTEVTPLLNVASRISGTGMFVPERRIPNSYFAEYLDTSDEWIVERTGIKERRWAEPGVSCSELAEPACRQAIEKAGLTPKDIDGIILATVTPDFVFPSTACFLQKRLGIPACLALDVNAVCTGFIYALTTADAYIRAGLANNVLVVGSEIYSRIIDPNDRGTCVLFGDAAAAVVLSAVKPQAKPGSAGRSLEGPRGTLRGIYGSSLGADGAYTDILCVPQGTAVPATAESLAAGKHYLKMEGREVFKLAVRRLGEINEQIVTSYGFIPEDVDYFISHQANKRILLSMAKHMNIPESKIPMNLEHYGNTSAASVPLLLAEMDRDGLLKPGALLALSAFGGGVTWGAVLLRW